MRVKFLTLRRFLLIKPAGILEAKSRAPRRLETDRVVFNGKMQVRAQLAASRREQAHRGVQEPNANLSHFPVLPGASPGHNDNISIKQFSGRLV